MDLGLLEYDPENIDLLQQIWTTVINVTMFRRCVFLKQELRFCLGTPSMSQICQKLINMTKGLHKQVIVLQTQQAHHQV